MSIRDVTTLYFTADLAVLSSCQSAVAGALVGGEAVSLARTLLRRGIQSVVASLWPVDDEATAFLMGAFYFNRELGTARALMSAMDMTRQQPQWAHPYFWAGFIAIEKGAP
jgi:CHAT domain-containing protein